MMVKRRLIKSLLCICLVVVTSSCGINNKNSYLAKFETFIVELEKSKDISKDELTSIKKDYLDFTETYYNKFESELTDNDKDLILELKTRYYTVMAKRELKGVGDILKDLGEQASEFINEILE
jgi:hypothetical protein